MISRLDRLIAAAIAFPHFRRLVGRSDLGCGTFDVFQRHRAVGPGSSDGGEVDAKFLRTFARAGETALRSGVTAAVPPAFFGAVFAGFKGVASGVPTGIFSPGWNNSSATVPSCQHSTSTAALVVSTTATTCPFLMTSPGCTFHSSRVVSSMSARAPGA